MVSLKVLKRILGNSTHSKGFRVWIPTSQVSINFKVHVPAIFSE